MQQYQSIIAILTLCFAVSQTTDSNDQTDCGPHTVRVPPCVDYCPPTCAVPNPTICPRICLQKGCVCEKGYIRSESRNSPCIPKSKCPKPNNNQTHPIKCGRNEVPTDCYNNCVTACNRRGPIYCPLERCGTKGCFCAEGYIRLDWQKKSPCVPISECPCTDDDSDENRDS